VVPKSYDAKVAALALQARAAATRGSSRKRCFIELQI